MSELALEIEPATNDQTTNSTMDQIFTKRKRADEQKEDKTKPKRKTLVPTDTISLSELSFANLRWNLQGDYLEPVQDSKLPIYIEMIPDGVIPHKIGLKKDAFGHKKFCVNIENAETQKELHRLDAEWAAFALSHSDLWKKTLKRPEKWSAQFSKLIPATTKKAGQSKEYSPLFSADWDDDDFEAGKLRVRSKDVHGLIRNEKEIVGSKCTRCVWELKGVKLGNGTDKKTGEFTRGGWSKKIKLLTIEKNTDFFEYVNPEDFLTHDPECFYQHIISLDVATLDCDRDLELLDMVFGDPAILKVGEHRVPSARLVRKGTGCPAHFRLSCGGKYPTFALSYNKEFKSISTTFSLNDDAERTGLKKLKEWLRKKSIELRDVWYPDVPRMFEGKDDDFEQLETAKSNEVVGSWVKGILLPPAPKKDKEKKVIAGEYWPANTRISIDKNDFDEPFFADETPEEAEIRILNKQDPVRLYHLKSDSSAYRVVDVDGNRVTDLAQVPYACWQTHEFVVKNVYLQKERTKFATKMLFTKLAHSKDDYMPKDSDDHEEPEEASNE